MAFTHEARAQALQPQQPPVMASPLAPADPEEDEVPVPVFDTSPRLDRNTGFGLGLEAYGGLALLVNGDAAHSHALVGALTRLRFKYVQVGASLELSDRSEDRWRAVGAFAGVYLPFRNWVDFDAAAGFEFRHYINPDERYGSGGYDFNLPAITLRLGFSDRTSDEPLAARFGGGLVAAFDIGRKEADWQYSLEGEGGPTSIQGTSTIGGTSIGLVFTAGFDVGARPHTARVPAEELHGGLNRPARN